MNIDIVNFYQINEIVIEIIYQSDIDVLQILYFTSKIFTNHLQNSFILKRLQLKWDLQKFPVDNFRRLLYNYQNKIDAPKFNIFDLHGFYHEINIWHKKTQWINRLHKLQTSELVSMEHFGFYELPSQMWIGNLNKATYWTDFYIYKIENNMQTPNEEFYDTINNLYYQLNNK